MAPRSTHAPVDAEPLGRYQPFAKLGSGGQADVFLAVARGPMRFNKLVVVKRLKREVAEHPELVTMFLDEARLAARLNHPNVVQTFEVGESQGQYFIAMEYLDGQPLNRLLRVGSAAELVPPEIWAYVVAEALNGLHHAHELRDYDGTPLGIVHRDISPHNVFVTYDGEVKIVDFGIAKATLNNARTETGIVKGKAAYMAPEQAYGAPLDRRADLFAMGIVLWEAVTGRRLFEGEPVTVMNKLVNDPIPRARSVNPKLDPELDAIVAHALAKDPSQRYQTAAEMHDALEAYVRRAGGVRKADLGRILAGTFREERDAVHAQIQKHMASLADGAPPAESDVRVATSLRPLPEIGHAGTPSHVKLRLRALDTQADALRRRSRARGLAVAGAAIAVVLIAFALRPTPGGDRASTAPLAAPRTATPVHVVSEPEGAEVEWNGRTLGRTPLDAELPPGLETLIFRKEGYLAETRLVDVPNGPQASVELSASLRPVPAAPSARPPVAPSASAPHATPPPSPPRAHAPAPSSGTSASSAPPSAHPSAPPAASSAAPIEPTHKPVRPIDPGNPFEPPAGP